MTRQTSQNGRKAVLPEAYMRLMAISAIVISIVVNPVSGKVYYACPEMGKDGSSVESPFGVAEFWKDGTGKPRHYSSYGVDQSYGCFGMDRIDRGPTKGSFVYGCIACRLKSQRVVSIPGLFFMRCRGPHDGWFENCAAIVEAGATDVRTFNLTNVNGRNLTAVGGLNPDFGKGDISNIIMVAGTEGPVV